MINGGDITCRSVKAELERGKSETMIQVLPSCEQNEHFKMNNNTYPARCAKCKPGISPSDFETPESFKTLLDVDL
jgi:hypothetical protein